MDSKVLVGAGVIALLAVLFWPSGSSQKVRTLFEEAEQFLAQERFQDAIEKYEAALVEADQPFVKTEVIDPDFKTLANYKIAFAYTQIADQTGDVTQYDKALKIIEPLYANAQVPKHRELITFLWGYVLYKEKKYEEADPKFRELIDNFPNSMYLENAWYSIAQLNYELHDYDKARAAYKQIVDAFPNSEFRDDSQLSIAQTFLIEKNFEQAFREFARLTAEDFPESPLIPEAQYKAAYSLKQLDRLEEAIDRYNRFVTDFPDSVFVTAAYFDLGGIYTQQKDYDNAVQNYQLAIENTDDMALRAEIQYEIGDNYLEAQDYLSAVEAYRKVIDTYPDSEWVSPARFSVGEAYMKEAAANTSGDNIDEENYRNAIAAYQDVLNEDPGSEYESNSMFQIAEAYYQIRDYESALQWYRNVQERFPDDPLAPYALYGELWSLSDLGRNDEVLDRGRAFIETHSNDPDFDLQAAEIQMKLGDIMFEQEDFGRAAEEYAKVDTYEELPKFYAVKLRSLYQEGVSHFRLGEQTGDTSEYEKAIPPLAKAIEKYSDDVFDFNYEFPERRPLLENAIMNKAHVHEQLEQWDEARAAYALIPQTSENYGRAVVLIAETYEKEKNIEEAINRYRAISDDTTLGETWQSLGAIRLADLLRGAERWQEAAEAYQNIVERYPNSQYVDAAQYLIGVCYYSMEPRTAENLRKSIEAFRVVVDNKPDSENAPDALYGIVLSTKVLAEQGEASWQDVVTLAEQLTTQYGDRTDARARKAVNSGNLMRVLALEQLGTGDIDSMVASLRDVVASDAAEESARVTAQMKIGNLLFQAERYEDAYPEYEKLGELFPNSSQAPLAFYQAAVSAYKHAEEIAQTDENAATEWYVRASDLAGKALTYDVENALVVSINYTRGLAQSKAGKVLAAIQSLKNVTALEGTVTDPERAPLVEAAHIELARLHRQLGENEDAAREYAHIAETSSDASIRQRTYLSLADLYENQLGDLPKAVESYLNAAKVQDDRTLAAQALYRAGVILSELAASSGSAEQAQAAVDAFEQLQDQYSDSTDENVQLMIADAGIRSSDLYVKTGNIDGAIQKAVQARDRALQGNDIVQKVQAAYQVANLRARKARTVYDSSEGAANTEYKAISRQAVQDYLQAVDLAEPLDQAPPNARAFVGPALFQAGAISYAIHGPVDLPIAIDALPRFVRLVDDGVITATPEDVKTALYYAGVTFYDLARGSDMDVDLFSKSAQTLQQLVNRFPNDKDAGLWQYQVGEAYFAAQQFEDAVKAYLATVENYPTHPDAPEALYSAAAAYGNLGQVDNVFKVYQQLAEQYPDSQYAAEAFISVGDARYNEAADASLTDQQRIEKLREALDFYNRVLSLPKASDQAKATASGYIKETGELLASLEYGPLEEELNTALANPEDQEGIRQIIQKFDDLIARFPKSSSAQIALTKIGDAYVALEEWQKALDAYNQLMSMYVDANGRPMTPGDEYVGRALKYAQSQYVQIRNYVQQLAETSESQ